MIVVIGGDKGGTGKTTVATNLAVMRASVIGAEELIFMDTDDTPSGSFWCSQREDSEIEPRITSIQKRSKAVGTESIALSKKYQDIIIDAGGGDTPEQRGALLAADKAIFPLRPSQFDLWTLGRLSTLVNNIKEVNEKLEPYILLNQANTNPKVKEPEFADAKLIIEDYPIFKFLDHVIHDRIAFRKAAINGQGVVEYRPEDRKAVQEVHGLYSIIYDVKVKPKRARKKAKTSEAVV